MITERYHTLIHVGVALDHASDYLREARRRLVGQQLEACQDILKRLAEETEGVYGIVREETCKGEVNHGS